MAFTAPPSQPNRFPVRSKEIQINTSSAAVSSSSWPKTDNFFAHFELKEQIGTGSTSVCHKCVRKSDGAQFACKVIDKRQVETKFSGLLDQFYVEIKVLRMLNHANIIKLEDAYDSNGQIFMVMEPMAGGELFDYVVDKGTLSEEEASVMVRKIISALAHMHSKDIIHRDLKPENLLLTSKFPDAEVKLIDFGLAKVMTESVARSFLGTRGYLAPEMLQRDAYDKAIDVWALGIIVFVLLCGCLPFDDDSNKIDTESAARKKFSLRFPRWAMNLSPSAKDLLHSLLDVNPKTRLTAEEALNHPWVMGKSVGKAFLESPGKIGARRKDLQSPRNLTVEAVQNRMKAANQPGSKLAPIDEEGSGGKKKSTHAVGRDRTNSF